MSAPRAPSVRAGARRRRVCFVVGNTNAGVGGQFWDLRTVVEALHARIDPFIVNVGLFPSQVVEQTAARSFHIPFQGTDVVAALARMRRIIRDERPDVVHLFDNRVFAFARFASLVAGAPLVFTKCGGENPTGYYPYVRDVVVVSRENERFFRETPRFAGVVTHFLPNRVRAPAPDPEGIRKLRDSVRGTGTIFLTISRLATPYREHLHKGIDLVERLNRDGVPCRLAVVGSPQDADVVAEVRSRESDRVQVFSDGEFTRNPSRLIDVADLVIGMGRGVMEAAARARPLLTQVRESEFPVLVTRENFATLFETNFSPRNSLPGLDAVSAYALVQRAVADAGMRTDLGQHARQVFDRWFNVESVIDDYSELYEQVHPDVRLRLGNFLLGVAYSMKVFRRERRALPPTADSLGS